MPKLTGIFEKFKDLDAIPVSDIISSLNIKGDPHIIQDFIGNRVLYPQTVPQTSADLEIDHKILTEALKRQPELLFNKNTQSIILTEEFTNRFPPFIKLVATIIDSIAPGGLISLFLKNAHTLRLGTIVTSSLIKNIMGEKPTKQIFVNGEVKNLTFGTINLLPYKLNNLRLKLGQDQSQEIIVSGGEMGIFLDLRGM